jgi:hypothetical protein
VNRRPRTFFIGIAVVRLGEGAASVIIRNRRRRLVSGFWGTAESNPGYQLDLGLEDGSAWSIF